MVGGPATREQSTSSHDIFVKDKIESGEMSVEYKPTGEMWCDVLTKPKQGQAFRKHRAMLMNCDVDYCDIKAREDIPKILLPQPEGPVDPASVTPITPQNIMCGKDRRSVFDGHKEPLKTVTWNTSQNKVDTTNEKLRKRHLELVIARIMRSRAA
jgi:hypothetical protein